MFVPVVDNMNCAHHRPSAKADVHTLLTFVDHRHAFRFVVGMAKLKSRWCVHKSFGAWRGWRQQPLAAKYQKSVMPFSTPFFIAPFQRMVTTAMRELRQQAFPAKRWPLLSNWRYPRLLPSALFAAGMMVLMLSSSSSWSTVTAARNLSPLAAAAHQNCRFAPRDIVRIERL